MDKTKIDAILKALRLAAVCAGEACDKPETATNRLNELSAILLWAERELILETKQLCPDDSVYLKE